MKYCNKCGFEKPFSEFNKKTASKDGHVSLCKDHTRANVNAWFKRNAESERIRLKAKKTANVIESKQFIMDAKSKPCADCGESYPYYVMDFDHLPGQQKLFNISDANRSRQTPRGKLLAEIAKCEVVCSNCHRERTFNRDCRVRSDGLSVPNRALYQTELNPVT